MSQKASSVLFSTSLNAIHHETFVRYNGQNSKKLKISRCVKQCCVLALMLISIYFSAIFMHAFPQPSGKLLNCRNNITLFNLAGLREEIKIRRVFICRSLCPDDSAISVTFEAELQASALHCSLLVCQDLGIKINPKEHSGYDAGNYHPSYCTYSGKPLAVVGRQIPLPWINCHHLQ